MKRRVVITGMGAVTPLGHSVREMFEAQLAGKSGVGPIFRFDASAFPTTFASQVKDFDLANFVPNCERWKHSGVNSTFAAAAGQQALADAGVLSNDRIDRTRFGVYLGSGEGIQDFPNLIHQIACAWVRDKRSLNVPGFCRGAMSVFNGEHEGEQELHTTAGHLGGHFGLEGPNFNCLTACAASSQALGEAMEIIRHGDADLMLSGGSHSMIHPLGVSGFNLLTALSQNNANPQGASRPFDLHRDGFVLGEGAGMLVLEEYEHAKRRGANVYAELTGYGTTADAFRVTDSCPDGRGAIACMEGAIKDSGVPR